MINSDVFKNLLYELAHAGNWTNEMQQRACCDLFTLARKVRTLLTFELSQSESTECNYDQSESTIQI
jgi:hypothetical protein